MCSFHPGVYFALCLSLMVVSLLETIFITYLLHLAATQPPPLPRWLHSLLLHCTSPRKCCPVVAPQRGNSGQGLGPAHLPGEGSLHSPHSLLHPLQFPAPASVPAPTPPQLTLAAHS